MTRQYTLYREGYETMTNYFTIHQDAKQALIKARKEFNQGMIAEWELFKAKRLVSTTRLDMLAE